MYPKLDTQIPTPSRHPQLGKTDLDGIDLLLSLGLTDRQARVYIALLKVGASKARIVAEVASLSRQEVYHLLRELEEFGLVQQNLTVPISYTAIPIADAIQLLLYQRTSQLEIISQKAKGFSKKLEQPSLIPQMIIESKPCFGMVCEGDRNERFLKAIKQTQHTLYIVANWLTFKQLCSRFESVIKSALKRNVVIKIAIERPANHQLPKWVDAMLQKHSNFKLKTLTQIPIVAVTIFDSNLVAVAFDTHTGFTKGPILWTTHPSLTILCQSYVKNALA